MRTFISSGLKSSVCSGVALVLTALVAVAFVVRTPYPSGQLIRGDADASASSGVAAEALERGLVFDRDAAASELHPALCEPRLQVLVHDLA